MSNIVERLRAADISGHGEYSALVREAAVEIKRLSKEVAGCHASDCVNAPSAKAEIERLRAALSEIADEHPYPGMGEELQQIARAVLFRPKVVSVDERNIAGQTEAEFWAWVDAQYPGRKRMDDELSYATRLAMALWERHWKDDAPDWKPLPDLMGVLTQIDNMTVGLVRAERRDG